MLRWRQEPREIRNHFVVLRKRIKTEGGGLIEKDTCRKREVIPSGEKRRMICCSQNLTLHEFYISVQQDCNSASKLAWTNNNALSCSDNVACTKNDRCSNGVCSGTPFTCLPCEECYNDACRVKPGFCVINDGGTRKCFNHGALRPGYPCQVN